MKHLVASILAVFSVFIPILSRAADAGFPGRSLYPNVSIYSKAELKQKLAIVVPVDARSRYEFDVLHIKGAINIPLTSRTFSMQVKALRSHTHEPIVFYCNGRTCMKAYLAARKASAAGVSNIHAYDAGMYAWAKTYPDDSVLLGKHKVKPGDIISLERYEQHMLTPSEFGNKVYQLGKQSVILDVRDKYQRGKHYVFPGLAYWISLDQQAKLLRFIEKAKHSHKTLFIYDQVGRQVQWVQYLLIRNKVEHYYFMQDGAKAYYAGLMRPTGTTQ